MLLIIFAVVKRPVDLPTTRFEEKLKIEAVNGAAAAGADRLTQQKPRRTRAQHSDHMKKNVSYRMP